MTPKAANSQRGVLFILLLGFMLQSVVVVATDFFEFDNPDWQQYAFIGSTCLLLFCIKLLYCDDANTLASDHAMLVNRTAAAFFSVGQFALLFSTTILGSGLNLLTHHYLAATAALPGNDKAMVCAGFAGTCCRVPSLFSHRTMFCAERQSNLDVCYGFFFLCCVRAAVLLSLMFTKSMHIKRVPIEPKDRALFVGAYVLQTLATIAVVGITIAIIYGRGGYIQTLVQSDLGLMGVLCGLAVLLVLLSWLDEGLELALQGEGIDGKAASNFLVSPFGFWWCLHPEVTPEEILAEEVAAANASQSLSASQRNRSSGVRLSEFSPLLSESVAHMKVDV